MKRFYAIGMPMVALILCFTFTLHLHRSSAADAGLPFDDITQNFATEAIVNLSKINLISGTGGRTFEPTKAITRAELVALLDRLLGMTPVSSAIPSFSDVPKTAWYYEWVQPAIQLGIAQGTSNALFEPNRPVTREEAAVLMARALKQPAVSPPADSQYVDQDQIHSWALPSVYQLSHLGIIEGDSGSYRPEDSITRQEATVMMYRAWTRPGWSEQIRATPPQRIQLGWQYGETTRQFEQQVAQSEVNTVSPRWFYLGKTSTVEDHTDTSLIEWAHNNGKKVWAMVGNHSDQEISHQMLSQSDQRQAFILKLTELVRKYGIDGLNIDFENIGPQDRNSFTTFIKELSQQMKTIPAVLSVNVSPDFGMDWTEVFDYSELGKTADYVILMGYDEHWGGAPEAGSVSSLPWLRHGIETLLKQVPARKVILALPLYTRNWTISSEGKTTSADWSLVQQNQTVNDRRLSTSWNNTLGQYYAQYSDKAMLNKLWLEDGRSLSRKAMLGEAHSLAGYGYWYMGGESVDIWTSLRNVVKFGSYSFS
ncbi:S-layer homology domain-containing protein [Cohnella lupini]|uniref:Spore germination protein YaaH n=1 Tax=Cohnella lupini TaxID=1294267 RepID=A0A3D9ICH4_9BACL|nr:S-layer homology domain-containing protein [Cohnella lupini]RED59355.1 spore germination protein YaaH [Cohnella lupini]